jgi:hypothetical protein
VALLEQAASPERVIQPPQTGEAPTAAITTVELAEQTGTNRAGWNNWARPDRIGQVRQHPEAGSWRLVGKIPGPSGGPSRWLWEQS